jgi:hypothetical protein
VRDLKKHSFVTLGSDMDFKIQNRKYYKRYDDSDNACCWQTDVVGQDVEAVLSEAGITRYDSMYEDWGVVYSWHEGKTEYQIQFECTDVNEASYHFLVQGFRKKLAIFTVTIPDEEMVQHPCVSLLRALDETSQQEDAPDKK